MANISKINQKLTQFGPAPQRTDPANFPTRANAMVAHFLTHLDEQNIMSEQYNTSIDELNTTITDMNNKHQEILKKHTDFIPKYDDLADKYDKFIPKYNDTVKKHGEVVSHSTHVDSVKAQIDIDLERAKSFINEQNNVINDTKISEVSTWSSTKIKEEFGKKVGIDDNTVSILNLKILKEKASSNPPAMAQILFRTQNGQSFEIADLQQLYQTLKGYIDVDFVSGELNLIEKKEPLEISGNLVLPISAITTTDGTKIFYSNLRSFSYSQSLLKLKDGVFSKLNTPAVGGQSFRMVRVYENNQHELYLTGGNHNLQVYKLDRSGSGSWQQISNPNNVFFFPYCLNTNNLAGVTQGQSDYYYKVWVLKNGRFEQQGSEIQMKNRGISSLGSGAFIDNTSSVYYDDRKPPFQLQRDLGFGAIFIGGFANQATFKQYKGAEDNSSIVGGLIPFLNAYTRIIYLSAGGFVVYNSSDKLTIYSKKNNKKINLQITDPILDKNFGTSINLNSKIVTVSDNSDNFKYFLSRKFLKHYGIEE